MAVQPIPNHPRGKKPKLTNLPYKDMGTARGRIRKREASRKVEEMDAYLKKYGKDPNWAEDPAGNNVHGPMYVKTGKPKKGEDLQPYRNFIVNRSMSKHHMNLPASIGKVANMEHESYLDPTIWQRGMKKTKTLEEFPGGYGLIQVERPRRELDRTNLRKFANAKDIKAIVRALNPFRRGRMPTKSSMGTTETQVDFVGEEMDNSTRFGDVRKRMNESNDPVKAAMIFSVDYEKANPNKSHDNRRRDIARRIARRFKTEPGF